MCSLSYTHLKLQVESEQKQCLLLIQVAAVRTVDVLFNRFTGGTGSVDDDVDLLNGVSRTCKSNVAIKRTAVHLVFSSIANSRDGPSRVV